MYDIIYWKSTKTETWRIQETYEKLESAKKRMKKIGSKGKYVEIWKGDSCIDYIN